MPAADKLEWPQGQPLFEVMWQSIADSLDGHGIIDSGDMLVSVTATSLEIEVAAGGAWYLGTEYTLDTAETHALSAGDTSADRWDTVYFDTATSSSGVREGTPAASPEPPDVQGDELLLAVVYVPAEATDVPDEEVLNWRVRHQAAAEVRVEDAEDEFENEALGGVLTELVRSQGDNLDGPLTLDDFTGGSVLDLGDDPGPFGPIVDAAVADAPQGEELSYSFAFDGGTFLRIYAESDGNGGVQNLRATVKKLLRIDDDIETTGETTIWDSTEGEVPQEQLGGPAGEFSDYPIPLGTDTDGDLSGTNLDDSEGPGTLYDASTGEFPRGVLDINKRTTVVSSSSYTTNAEEHVLVDTAAVGAEVTITLSSSSNERGREVAVVDVTGAASNYGIRVETEGTEQINGASVETIGTDYTGRVFVSNGENWTTTAPAPLRPARQIEGAESGEVSAGNQGILITDSLADGETVELEKAIFHLATGEPAPTDLDLIIATLDNSGNYIVRETIYSGDGATVWDGDPATSVGDPLTEWTNETGGRTTVAVLVDNGTADPQAIMAKVTGERV